MKRIFFVGIIIIQIFLISCRSTKQIGNVIAPKDTVTVIANQSSADSLLQISNTLKDLKAQHIDFNTFSAKIKVEVEDSKGKQPDITAVVRIKKDEAIWISLSATFLNIEVYRVFITRDSVILLNKRDKEVQYRSLDYLQEVTQIPFDFATLQDLLIGNPVFFNDSIVSYKRFDNYILLSSIGNYFKNLLTLNADNKQLTHSKLDDVDVARNRTADISYGDYENASGVMFSTYRHIVIAEKNKMDIRMKYRQVEFNKELSISFHVPKNYDPK